MFGGQAGNKYLKYITLGAEIAGSLGVPILVGYYLDMRYATLPWFTLGGIVLGITLFLLIAIKLVRDKDL